MQGINNTVSLAFTVVIFLFTTQVFASLLELDYVAGSGDKRLTFDSSSNLEWLDLTLTKGQSVVQVEAGFGGYRANGFRYATGVEVLDLFASAGVPQGDYSDGPRGKCRVPMPSCASSYTRHPISHADARRYLSE
jgi:hypothetical protein